MTNLLQAWLRRSFVQHGIPGISRIELHLTPDITTNPPGNQTLDFLVNPANERLEGTKFTPAEANSKLAHNTGIIYPEQSVDGRVGELGGLALQQACRNLPEVAPGGVRCHIGAAVMTEATGMLLQGYRSIVHTVPPVFYISHQGHNRGTWQRQLASCYTASLGAVWHAAPNAGSSSDIFVSVAIPLLGAGARGIPVEEAAHIAAQAVAAWVPPSKAERHVGTACNALDSSLAYRQNQTGERSCGHAYDISSQFFDRNVQRSTFIDVKFAVIDDFFAGELEEALSLQADLLQIL